MKKNTITKKDLLDVAYKSILFQLEDLYCSTYKTDEIDFDFIEKLKFELQLLVHTINNVDYYKKFLNESEAQNG